MEDMQEMLAEFLIECGENLEEFENNLLALEENHKDSSLLDSMFRMIHSIKGASGFFAFNNLESLTHKTENVLDLLRSKKGEVNQDLISTFLEVCDSVKEMFESIENTSQDGDNEYASLKDKLINYETEFKAGTQAVANVAAAEKVEDVAETESLSPVASTEGMDATQLEALASLGMLPEQSSAASEDTAAQDSNLDATQLEALASLGIDVSDMKVEEATSVDDNINVETKTKTVSEAKKQAATIQKKETIRVDVQTLNKLVNLAGELVLVRNQVLELAKSDTSHLYDKSFASLDLVTGEIQRALMSTRMQPISSIWGKAPRVVRDLCKQLSKDVQVIMEGENTELDKTVLEAISDPMTHIIRNCLDHGIETPEERAQMGKDPKGTIRLIAEHRGNWIHLDIIDDGKGISRERLKAKALEKELYTEEELEAMSDREVLNIIFHAGFSTKEQVSNVSGRGVGMDVIKSNINKINGTVEMESEEGAGTHLRIKLPLTLAIVSAIIASIDGRKYAIPQNAVQEVASIAKDDIETLDDIQGQKFTRLRGEILPLIYAADLLQHGAATEAESERDSLNYLVINSDGFVYGLVIDNVIDIIEIVVKPLDSEDDNFEFYSGATIMGDGKVALILDTSKIAEVSKIDQIHQDAETKKTMYGSVNNYSGNLTLLFKLANQKDYLIPLNKSSRIEEIKRDDIERRNTGTFAKFNNTLIRIIDLACLLGIGDYLDEQLDEDGLIKVLYFEFNGQGIGVNVGTNHTLLQKSYDIQPIQNSEFIIGTSLIDGTCYEVINIEEHLSAVINASADLNLSEQVAMNVDLELKETNLLSEANSNNALIISFEIGELFLGIDINSVSEIINREFVTAIPGSDSATSGLLNLRGDILVSKSLTDILNLSGEDCLREDYEEHTEDCKSLIVNSSGHKVCLEVGKVNEILSIEKDKLNAVPTNIPDNIASYIKSVYKLDDKLLLLLNEEKLVPVEKTVEV